MAAPRIIPKRLEERIHEAGLSYSAVARALGVRQPTISRLVKGEQRSTARIDHLARIVKTSPAYLTGEVDDPDLDAPETRALTSDQEAWLAIFDALDPPNRTALMQIGRTMVIGMNRPTVNAPKPRYTGEGE